MLSHPVIGKESSVCVDEHSLIKINLTKASNALWTQLQDIISSAELSEQRQNAIIFMQDKYKDIETKRAEETHNLKLSNIRESLKIEEIKRLKKEDAQNQICTEAIKKLEENILMNHQSTNTLEDKSSKLLLEPRHHKVIKFTLDDIKGPARQ
ncbi:hypothetical protein GJ496_002963 [Pomphorhynchus laevis]|nr:hypothetical protein GJ496_002963 [Pomphorhynchus laevis]